RVGGHLVHDHLHVSLHRNARMMMAVLGRDVGREQERDGCRRGYPLVVHVRPRLPGVFAPRILAQTVMSRPAGDGSSAEWVVQLDRRDHVAENENYEWACSSAGRASALQTSRQNHISAASGVAYAGTRGATTLLSWTEVGLKVVDHDGCGGLQPSELLSPAIPLPNDSRSGLGNRPLP